MAKSRLRRLILIAGVSLVVIAGTAAAFLLRGRRDVTTTSEEAYRFYREGLDNEMKLYSREAISAYAEALKHDPHFVMATVRLAEQLRGKDLDRAKGLLQCCSRFKDEVSPRERLLFDIVEADLNGDRKKVETLVDEFRSRYPSDPEGFHRRASLLSATGRSDEAAKEFERLVALNPNYAAPYNMLGYYWLGKGDAVKAEEYFKRYRFLAPDQANPHDSLGEMYAAVGRYDEAVASLKKALAVKPDFFPSLGHLGTVEIGRGNYEKAADYYNQAAKLVEGQERFGFRLDAGCAYLDAGDVKRADEELSLAMSELAGAGAAERALAERSVPSLEAVFLIREGRATEGEKALEAARQLPPGLKEKEQEEYRVRILLAEGGLAHLEGRYGEAVEKLRAGLAGMVPKEGGSLPYYDFRVAARLALADSLSQLGRRTEAEEALQPILSRNPSFHAAVLALASIRQGPPKPDEVNAAGR